MSTNPYSTYQNNSVLTATSGELTLMLYEGCLKFIRFSKHAIEQNNVEDKNKYIQKAQAIISELIITLDTKIDISSSMASLYDYIQRRLIEANIKSDVSILEEVEGLVVEFRDTWKTVIQMNRSKVHSGGVV